MRTIVNHRTPRGKRHRRWLIVSNYLTRLMVEDALRGHSNVESYRGITHDRDNQTHVHVGLELVETRTATAVEAMFPVPVKVIPYVGLQGDPHQWGRTYRYFLHETPDSRHKASYHLEEIWTSPGVDVHAALAALAVREERDATTKAQVFRQVADGMLSPDDLYALGGVHRRIWQDNLAALTRLAESVTGAQTRLSEKAHRAAQEAEHETRRAEIAAQAEQAEKAAQRAAKKAEREAARKAEELAAQQAEEARRREEFARSPEGIAQARQEAQDAERDGMAVMMRYTYRARSEVALMRAALRVLDDNGEADDAENLGFTGADLAATLVDGRISHAGLMMLVAYDGEERYAAEDEELHAAVLDQVHQFEHDMSQAGMHLAALEVHAADGDESALNRAEELRRDWACVREFEAPRPDLPKAARQRLLDASKPTNPDSR